MRHVAPIGSVVVETASTRWAGGPRQHGSKSARHCAREALIRLGAPAVVIPRGRRGQPVWPSGVVGSITHCPGWEAACVGFERDIVALGVDVDLHRPFGWPSGILGERERAGLRDLETQQPERHWATVAFSAKESVYKAWFPRFGTWLGFRDVEVTLYPARTPDDYGPDRGTLDARLVRPMSDVLPGDPGTEFEGRYIATDDYVATVAFWRP